jgi:pimeloyl-ACP methyl ester carboxylesterase
MFTDIVGYTYLVANDEAKAIQVRERYRDIMRVLVEQFQGKVVDATGDEFLVTFPSALGAVDCALAIQTALRDDPDLRLRIGIHLGEVVKQGDEVIGDGVNIASRIRPLAEPGGICVSEAVLHLVRNRSYIRAESLGAQSLKNVDQRLKVFALAAESSKARSRSRRRRIIKVFAGVGVILLVASVIFVHNRVAILSSLALTLPRLYGNSIEQKIGFATTSDGVRIAYATTGQGPPVVSVVGWATHLQRGWGSPMYDSEGWIRWLSERHLFVRYDGRGFGLSDRNVEDFSLEARVSDLEAVVDALGLEGFALYAISAGGPTAIAYTVRHSERVSGLILAGTAARMKPSFDPEERRQWEGMIPLFRSNWDSPIVRSMMTTFLLPEEGDEVLHRVVSQFLKISGDGPAIAGFFDEFFRIDTRELVRRIDVPTLVVHGQEDRVIELELGRDLASLIPGARFEIVRGANHTQGALDSPKTRELIAEFLAPLSSD